MQYEINENESMAYAVPHAVATYEDRSLAVLPELENIISADALNKLCCGSYDATPRISFHYSDSYVIIDDDTIFVSSEEPEQMASQSMNQ